MTYFPRVLERHNKECLQFLIFDFRVTKGRHQYPRGGGVGPSQVNEITLKIRPSSLPGNLSLFRPKFKTKVVSHRNSLIELKRRIEGEVFCPRLLS